MATTAELERALIAADAAGNVEDARALAQAISAQRKPNAAPEAPARATDGMSGVDKFRAGIGKSLVDTATGLGQTFLRNVTPSVPEFITRGGDAVEQAIDSPLYSRARKVVFNAYDAPRQALQQKVAERRETDADLMSTGAGIAGNVAGTLAQLLTPGVAARGTAAAPLLLPTTVRGNAIQGGLLGSIQPVADESERLGNSAAGAAGGLLGAAIPKVIGGGIRAAKGLLAPFTEKGAQDAAARVVTGFAEDPATLLARQPSAIPGVQRTLAEETLDPGVAQLQRTIAARNGAPFDMLRRSNNASRVNAIRGFAGDESTIAAAEAARDSKALPLLQQALEPQYVDGARVGVLKRPVNELLEAQIIKNKPRQAVVRSLNDAKESIDSAGNDIESLYVARKSIDDLLGGRAGLDKGYAKAATRELQQVKGALTDQMEKASPEFGQYLATYRDASGPINRMQLGQELLKRGSAGQLDPITGVETLMPAQFGRQMRGLDRLAQQATGFDKAKAGNILSAENAATLGSVNDDLGRQAFVDTAARGPGSDTFQKLMTQGDVLGAVQEMGVSIPGAGVIRMLGNSGRDRVNRQLIAILTDPASAQDVLRRASEADRRVIQGILQAGGGELGTALGVTAAN